MIKCIGPAAATLAFALNLQVAVAAPHGVQVDDMNRHVQACGDFYEFANGTWRDHNPIPTASSRWSRRIAAHDDNGHRQQVVLEKLALRSDWPVGSTEQIAGDHYAACMNESAVQSLGLQPLLPLLSDIDRDRTLADVQRSIRRLQDLGIPVPFTSSGNAGYHDPSHIIETIAAGGLGLPDRDDYVGDEGQFAETRVNYRKHIARVLTLGGMSDMDAQHAAVAIYSLESRLAAASLNSVAAADPATTDHMMTFTQLKALAPHFDWDSYFDEAHLPRAALNVTEPEFLQALDRALIEVPVDTWKVYLRWQLLDVASPSLPTSFAEESSAFHDPVSGTTSQGKSRAQQCVQSTDGLFGDALAKSYVQQYFPPSARAKAQDLVTHLRAALRERFLRVTWMSASARRMALKKLAATDVQIGYPEHWKSYSGVRVRRDTLWANVTEGRKFNVDQDRKLVGTRTRRDFWLPSPTASSADAYLIVELNKMVLPAGFLQPPFFDPDATDAVNYGAMGVAVAHDLTHFIDTLGAANDVQGIPNTWWTDADRQAFSQRGQCIVDQFDNYFIEPGVHLDGKRVMSESVADLAGLHIAYAALQDSMKTHPVSAEDGFTPEQQFFISWGQLTGASMRIEAQRQLIKDDPHPVPKFRVIGPLSNSPEFDRAFSCSASARITQTSAQRCEVW